MQAAGRFWPDSARWNGTLHSSPRRAACDLRMPHRYGACVLRRAYEVGEEAGITGRFFCVWFCTCLLLQGLAGLLPLMPRRHRCRVFGVMFTLLSVMIFLTCTCTSTLLASEREAAGGLFSERVDPAALANGGWNVWHDAKLMETIPHRKKILGYDAQRCSGYGAGCDAGYSAVYSAGVCCWLRCRLARC
jgi:hypothetical protein